MNTDALSPDDIDASFVPRRRDRIATAELDGEAVLYDEDSGRIHALDTIATVVWSCFDGTASVRSIAEGLAGAFAADWVVVENDVLALVRQLGSEGVLAGVAGDQTDDEDDGEATGKDPVGYEGDARGCA